MNELEQQLLHEHAGDAEPRFCIATKTRIDTGRWWRKTSLWLCIMEHELILFSVSRRRYIERIALSDCKKSHYNHLIGKLVIEPSESMIYNTCTIGLCDALRVLNFIKK